MAMRRRWATRKDEWLTCMTWVRRRHVVRISARKRQKITHDAEAGPHSELGETGSRRSFLRITHVPSLQHGLISLPCLEQFCFPYMHSLHYLFFPPLKA